ncbi:MAG: zinc ribbon domain-containing protein [Sulfurovum sp.]|nr:zinc ribbon domain-containing protein [Sulfurovum sp.]
MFKCDKCNAELEPNAKFCTTCGEKVSLEIAKNMESEKPLSKVKVWIFKSIAFFIALIVFTIARLIFTAINGGTADGKLSMGGILLFYGVYALLSGIFLKDKEARKRGSWILLIYVVASIAFSYFLNNSSYGIDEQLRQMSYKTPIKIDKDTELTKVTVNGNNVILKYNLINIAKDDIPYASLQNFGQIMKDEFCKDKDFVKIINHNKIVHMYYYGKYNSLISDITISNQECR